MEDVLIKIGAIYVILLAYSRYEVWMDQLLVEAFGGGKRSELENDLIHKFQVPIRAVVVVFTVLAFFPFGWLAFVVVINMAAMMWIALDLMINLIWLKQKWYYLGTTSKVDMAVNVPINLAWKACWFMGSWAAIILLM